MTYLEYKDRISQDLLAEFRDGADQTVKTGVKKGTVDDASKKPQAQKQACPEAEESAAAQ